MSKEQGIYVFCCIKATGSKSFGSIPFEGEEREVYTIHYKDAAMVAANVPMKIYHPVKENLMMHQDVISRVMEQEEAVVPVSFGNVFNSEEDLIALTKSLYPQLEKLFPQIEGKIEVGLKVIGRKEWLSENINQNEAVRNKKQVVQSKSEAAGYFDRIQLGEMAKDFFQSIQNKIRSEIHEELIPLTEAWHLNDPIGEKMLLNAAYLIDKGQEAAFDEKVNQLHDQWKDRVDFKYTGPWPAYNFINIKLKVEEKESS
ncbi:gas vesicle protein GvpF [Oceanobacillus piezotolerans]|uniref:Gas vesicle protein GvpF n=1 Tax=Oceanobacillus piezotolerans TaxID=2448030 RepID=A0A498D8K0_9BACI|nr:GvpL/GvpF family gas vesicle protein [Oceanobacillus piezotolerans]RLL42686.1 gas vesicle protein GvpF [Oceanobacillus piezotolerans]